MVPGGRVKLVKSASINVTAGPRLAQRVDDKSALIIICTVETIYRESGNFHMDMFLFYFINVSIIWFFELFQFSVLIIIC